MKRCGYVGVLLALGFGLSACGGGGGGSTPSVATTTGIFIDSNVSGLSYSCSSGKTGLTNEIGEYSCPNDGNVTFFIGTLELGTSPVADTITPYNLQSENPTTLINILQVLQTLDNDGNTSNGIEITESSRNLFDGFSREIDAIDFDTVALHTIGSALVTPSSALAHFNESLAQNGKKQVGFQSSLINEDTGGDGSIDVVIIKTFNDDGNLLTQSGYTNNLDGVLLFHYSFTYDANENVLSQSYDDTGDGIINRTITYTHDTNGNTLSISYDSDGDGLANTNQYYTYDIYGNVLSYSNDDNGDDTIDEITSYIYDTNGKKIINSLDTNVDGVADSITTYTYDANDNILTKRYDTDADETIDAIQTYTYDANGNMLTDSYDNGADGTGGNLYTYTYIYTYIHTSSLIPQVVSTRLTLHGQRCIHYENIFRS
ncbi:hypothetical protein [Sulfurimonas sp.]|uniref:hypothetical protein n=1 Tax=Sulfurimonas sp. TaxID=2022749 RepID=UPI003D095A31